MPYFQKKNKEQMLTKFSGKYDTFQISERKQPT